MRELGVIDEHIFGGLHRCCLSGVDGLGLTCRGGRTGGRGERGSRDGDDDDDDDDEDEAGWWAAGSPVEAL